MAITILIGSHAYLLAEGIKRLLEGDQDIQCIGIACCTEDLEALPEPYPDVIIADHEMGKIILNGIFLKPPLKVLLIHDNPTPISSLGELRTLIAKGLVGILSSRADARMFIRAIYAVHSGELWFDQKTVRDTLCGKSGQTREIRLTPKEKEVLRLVCAGCSNKEIAQKLYVSEQTVKSHCNHLYKKFGVKNRVKLVLHSSEITEGFLDLPEGG